MHQDRISENSNMLHYSNASRIEKSRRYLVIKGGLAWLLWQVGGVVDSVVELGNTYCRVRTHLAPLIVMSRIVMLMFALYLLFLPPLLSVVELGSSSVGLVVYRREEGGETVNTMQT